MPDQTRNLLFYDSDCGFCQASVDWMARHDIEEQLRFIPYHDLETIKQYDQIDPEHRDLGVQYLSVKGHHSMDSLAIADALKQLPSWRWLGHLVSFPLVHFFAQIGYRIITKNRHHISKLLGLNACKI